MKIFNFLLTNSVLLVLTTSISSANECQDFLSENVKPVVLSEPKTVNTSEVLPAVTARPASLPVSPRTSRDLVVQEVSKHTEVQMIQSGLLYSKFFNESVLNALIKYNRGTAPPNHALYLKSLTPSKLNDIANLVFQDMQGLLRYSAQGIAHPSLKNSAMALDVIKNLSDMTLIDKIGEALLIMAYRGDYIDLDQSVQLALNKGLIKPSSRKYVSGIIALGLGLGAVFTFGDVSYLTTGILGSLTSVGSFFTYKQIDRLLLPRLERQQVLFLQNLERPQVNGYNFYPNQESSDTQAILSALRLNIMENLDGIRDTEVNELQIGTQTGRLRAELSSVLQIELAKWLGATKGQILKVDEIVANRSAMAIKQSEINLLENLLLEAAKVTNELTLLSQSLSQSIKSDLAKMDRFTPERIQESNFDAMKINLQQRALGQDQFTATLQTIILKGVQDSILALRTIRDTQSNLQTYRAQLNTLDATLQTISDKISEEM